MSTPADMDSIRPNDSERVVASAALKSAEALGLKSQAMAKTLGIRSAVGSERELQRVLEKDKQAFDAAVKLIRVYISLGKIVGRDKELIRGWMSAQNRALQGTPLRMIEDQQGLACVVNYLEENLSSPI